MPIEFSDFGKGQPLVLIAGPCVIESEEHVHRMASGIRDARRLGVIARTWALAPITRHPLSVGAKSLPPPT